jgi:hypothetical protein
MHAFDDTPFMRKCPLLWTIRFDEILDADMLNEALSKLFEMDGWRRLGGRIRLNVSGFIASRYITNNRRTRAKLKFMFQRNIQHKDQRFTSPRLLMTCPLQTTLKHPNYPLDQIQPPSFQSPPISNRSV